jgi:deoxycytidylate deaminase
MSVSQKVSEQLFEEFLMPDSKVDFDWGELAFGSKKPIRELKAIFIMAPREISEARYKEIIKAYLPKGNMVVGIAKESYVLGLEDQPQFRMQKREDLEKITRQVNGSKSPHKIYTLEYFQRELRYLLESLKFSKVIGINGSWKYAFHTQAPYYVVANQKADLELISPFTDELEAKAFEAKADKEMAMLNKFPDGEFTEAEMLEKAEQAARFSYDYCFQTGVVIGKKAGKKYKFIDYAFNKVLPYQTYAMLSGASRETNFSPPHDLNHYDTVHAEVMLLIQAQKKKIDLAGTTVFINLLPCPTCARMLSETEIAEVVYQYDHSDGYALKVIEQSEKIIRRTTITS